MTYGTREFCDFFTEEQNWNPSEIRKAVIKLLWLVATLSFLRMNCKIFFLKYAAILVLRLRKIKMSCDVRDMWRTGQFVHVQIGHKNSYFYCWIYHNMLISTCKYFVGYPTVMSVAISCHIYPFMWDAERAVTVFWIIPPHKTWNT